MRLTSDDMEKWNEYAAMKQWGQGTKETYGYYIREWIGEEINQDNVNKYLAKQRNNYPSFLKNLFACFKIKDLDIVYPKGRKKRKSIVDHFSPKEMEVILSAITNRKLNLIIRLMYENGLRISEVLNLQKKDFNMVDKQVKGIGKGNEEFRLPLYNKTYFELEIYLRSFQDDDFVFRWDKIKSQRKKAWEVIKKEIGHLLPHKDPKEIYPHAFRHTCGTYLREQGFDLREIQIVLRHKNLETVSHYTAVDNARLNSKLRRLFE